MQSNHTVRRTNKQWSGIWTDLSIEQILIKSLKGRSGVVSKGISTNVMRVWTQTMHRCAEVTDAVSSILLTEKCQEQHKEIFPARVKRDYEDFQVIQSWFNNHNPFIAGEQLIALDTGVVDSENRAIGASIQKSLDGQTFSSCKFKRNDQISSLKSLYSSIQVEKENVTIDPLTLFLRLLVAVERKPENEIANYFNYELIPHPMSLFKDGNMCSTKKSALKTFLLKNVGRLEADPTESTRIIDGGALLWYCDWKRNETLDKICEKYSNFLSDHSVDIIVFDGYTPSTKDVTHRKRSGTFSETVEIKNNNSCTSDRTTFFSNYINKANFVKFLAEMLQRIIQYKMLYSAQWTQI